MADPIITSTNTGNRRNNMTMNSQQATVRNNPGQINRSVGQMSSYGVARSGMNQIRQGDVIRGEISDLRNNEITITLENNTLIKGQIADSSSLSIGQTAGSLSTSFRTDCLSARTAPQSCRFPKDVPHSAQKCYPAPLLRSYSEVVWCQLSVSG